MHVLEKCYTVEGRIFSSARLSEKKHPDSLAEIGYLVILKSEESIRRVLGETACAI